MEPHSHSPEPSHRYHLPEPVQRFVTSAGTRIYRIAGEVLPDYHGFSHLLLGDFPATLIDTGSGSESSRRDLFRGLEQVASVFGEPFQIPDLRRIWLTHTHHDHIGSTAELVELSGATVGVHPYDARLLVSWDRNAFLTRRATTTILAEAGVEPERARELVDAYAMRPKLIRSVSHVDQRFRDGEQIGPFTIHHVPGHSPGHVLFEIDGFAICGDHLLSRTVSQLWPQRMTPYTGYAHAIASLRKLETLAESGRVHTLLTGHEDVITHVTERVRNVLETHYRRNRRVLKILRENEGPMTASEIADRMYTHRHGFFGFLVVTDVVTRLEHLFLTGEVDVSNSEEIARKIAIPEFTPTRYVPLDG
ncbi:MAG: MBL fold metallo-hydrolase [Planctomycetia bacterium]|nr:MBL fold metallo-hydrolase [Planctomycetia bacterium]